MIYIYLKIALAALLCMLPFIYSFILRPMQQQSPVWRNSLTALAHYLPRMAGWMKRGVSKIRRFHEGLRRNITCRRMFAALVLSTLLIYQFVDAKASAAAVMTLLDGDGKDRLLTMMLSTNKASLAAFFMTPLLVSFRISDPLLSRLHCSPRMTCCTALAAIFLSAVSLHWLILTESILIICQAARLYPPLEKPLSS